MFRGVKASSLMVGDRVNIKNRHGEIISTVLDADTLRDLIAVESGEIGPDSPKWKIFDEVRLDEESLLADGFRTMTKGETYVKDLRFIRIFVDLVDERLVILERKCNVREEECFEEIIKVSAQYWHDLQQALRLSKLS